MSGSYTLDHIRDYVPATPTFAKRASLEPDPLNRILLDVSLTPAQVAAKTAEFQRAYKIGVVEKRRAARDKRAANRKKIVKRGDAAKLKRAGKAASHTRKGGVPSSSAPSPRSIPRGPSPRLLPRAPSPRRQ